MNGRALLTHASCNNASSDGGYSDDIEGEVQVKAWWEEGANKTKGNFVIYY